MNRIFYPILFWPTAPLSCCKIRQTCQTAQELICFSEGSGRKAQKGRVIIKLTGTQNRFPPIGTVRRELGFQT